jgi:hypothetical protein
MSRVASQQLVPYENGLGGSRDVLENVRDHDRRNDQKHEKLRVSLRRDAKLSQSAKDPDCSSVSTS